MFYCSVAWHFHVGEGQVPLGESRPWSYERRAQIFIIITAALEHRSTPQ